MIVERPDLSSRTMLSKSALVQYDLCPSKAWYSIHDPRPVEPNEKMTFGSAVDAGVEVIVKALGSGQEADPDRAMDAAAFIVERDGVEVDLEEVDHALRRFGPEVGPKFDWTGAQTQLSLTATIDGLGECNGHPDILLGSGVFDVKTAARAKTLPSVELGFYALLVEAAFHTRVQTVGYITWVRSSRPYWQVITEPATDELLRWAHARAGSYVRAKSADATLNTSGEPTNYSFGGGPKFPGLCGDCPYNPANGGPCQIAYQGEVA